MKITTGISSSPSANQPTENNISARFSAGIIAEPLGKVPAAFLGVNFAPLQTVLYYTASNKDKHFKGSKCFFIETELVFLR